MERARSGIIEAAAALVAVGGQKSVTMAAVGRKAAVAKATVYNHFRDRDELLRALLATERERMVAHCASVPRAEQLTTAARWLGQSAVIAGLRRHDPAIVLGLATAATTDDAARHHAEQWCAPGDDPDRALRWLISFAVAPPRSAETAAVPPTTP